MSVGRAFYSVDYDSKLVNKLLDLPENAFVHAVDIQPNGTYIRFHFVSIEEKEDNAPAEQEGN